MNVNEVVTNYRYQLDKLDTGTMGEITPEVIELAINNATETFIKNKYREIEGLVYRNEGFESIQKRIDDLRVLVKTETSISSTPFVEDEIYFPLVNDVITDYQFFLRASLLVNDRKVKAGIKIDKQDNLVIKANDPFNRSTIRRCRAYFEGNNIVVIKPLGATSIQGLQITYLKSFVEFSIDNDTTIELPPYTHREIILLAVQQTLEILESQRAQTIQEKVLSSE